MILFGKRFNLKLIEKNAFYVISKAPTLLIFRCLAPLYACKIGVKLDISFLIFFSTFHRPSTSRIIKQSLRRLNHLMVPFPKVTQEIHIIAISKQSSGRIEFVFDYNSL